MCTMITLHAYLFLRLTRSVGYLHGIPKCYSRIPSLRDYLKRTFAFSGANFLMSDDGHVGLGMVSIIDAGRGRNRPVTA